VRVDGDRADLVVGQPAQALPVLPRLAVVADGADASAKPDDAGLARRDRREVVVRKSFGAGEEGPPVAIEAAGALRACEPETVLRVEDDTANIIRRPASIATLREHALPVTAGGFQIEPGCSGSGNAAIARDCRLADVAIQRS